MLYVGNYLGRKGVGILRTVLADAARLHPDVRVTFVVDEAGATLVERDYRDTFGTHLEIRSWVDREALGQIYRAHDILIMPSLFEGFGKVWMEAMAEGTCVVGFAEGGLQDVARHEEHALLCDTGDTEALTALLDRALNDLDTTRQLGRRAQAQVRLFTWDRHANATERFVERALAKKAAARPERAWHPATWVEAGMPAQRAGRVAWEPGGLLPIRETRGECPFLKLSQWGPIVIGRRYFSRVMLDRSAPPSFAINAVERGGRW